MRPEWLVPGLVLILLGVLFSSAAAVTTPKINYILVGETIQSYGGNSPLETNVSADFAAGDRLFFNFTKGRYWSNQWQAFKPLNPGFSWYNYSVPDYKFASFFIHTPSGNWTEVGVYVVGGQAPYGALYSHPCEDITPLEGRNMTFVNFGIEGITNRAGTYTIEAIEIDPPSYRTESTPFDMDGDPPREMFLWKEETMQTRPYFSFMPLGVALTSVGVVTSAWAARAKRTRASARRS